MQDYPVYTVRGETSGERATLVELRVQMEAGGGLPGLETPEAVVQAVADAMRATGVVNVTASKTSVQTSNVSVN